MQSPGSDDSQTQPLTSPRMTNRPTSHLTTKIKEAGASDGHQPTDGKD
jgi:hypothetical protein